MPRKLFNFAALCSTIALCAFLPACFFAASANPLKQLLSLSRAFNISVDACVFDPRLEFFNDASYGPYSGSIIDVTGHGRRVESASLDFPGVYYRHFRWPDGVTLWTLSLSLFYFVAPAAVFPVAWLMRRLRRARRGFPVTGQPVAA